MAGDSPRAARPLTAALGLRLPPLSPSHRLRAPEGIHLLVAFSAFAELEAGGSLGVEGGPPRLPLAGCPFSSLLPRLVFVIPVSDAWLGRGGLRPFVSSSPRLLVPVFGSHFQLVENLRI